MPFPKQTPRPFTREDVASINAGQIGCYGIYRDGAWVYIGRGDIRTRLLSHLRGDNPEILRERPTHWVGVVTQEDETEERRLLVECRPICNQRLG